MIKIRRLIINKLYRRRNIIINFEDIMFLTGVNGAGKSTILNIVNALILKDILFFQKLDFEKITIELMIDGMNKRYNIEKTNIIKDFEKLNFENGKVYFVNNQTISEEKVKLLSEKNINLTEEEFNILLKENLSPLEKISDIIKTLLVEKFAKLISSETIEQESLRILNETNNDIRLEEKLKKEIYILIDELMKKQNIDTEISKKISLLYISIIKNAIEPTELSMELFKFFSKLLSFEDNKNHKIDKILKIINDFFQTSWKEIRINEEKRQLEVVDYLTENKKQKEIYNSLYKLSSGEKNLLIFIFNLYYLDDGIFLIDEPENSLHLDWQEKFSKFIKLFVEDQPNKQIIISTHSPDIVNEFETNNFAILYPYEKERDNVR